MEKTLTKGSVVKALLSFVLPFVASYILQLLYSIVDMMIVGRFADTASISAVNTSSQIMNLVLSLIAGIATGGTVIIGQRIGAEDKKATKRCINSMLLIFVGIAVVLTAVLVIFNHLVISIAQVPDEAVSAARIYLLICSFGTIFICGYNGICGVLRGLGDSKSPMYFVICSCLLNIAGDYVLVAIFHLGAAGAAAATVISQLASFVLAIIVLQRSEYRLTAEAFKFNSSEAANVLKIGFPLAAQDVLVNISFLIITIVVNTMGVDKSAAVGIGERTIGFFCIAPIAFLAALSAFTAQNIGAGLVSRAKQGLKASILICMGYGVAVILIVWFFAEFIIGLYTTDAAVIMHGSNYIRSYIFDNFMLSFVFCLNGFFSGYGKTGFVMANALTATFCVRLPIVIALSFVPDISLSYIGMAAPIASVVQTIMQLIYYRRMDFSPPKS